MLTDKTNIKIRSFLTFDFSRSSIEHKRTHLAGDFSMVLTNQVDLEKNKESIIEQVRRKRKETIIFSRENLG